MLLQDAFFFFFDINYYSSALPKEKRCCLGELAEPPSFPYLTGKNGNIAPRGSQDPICYPKLRDGGTGGQSLSSTSCEKIKQRFLKHVKAMLCMDCLSPSSREILLSEVFTS